MPNGESSLLAWLIGTGGVIALGKLLASSEPITLRLALGRIILGSAVSSVAGLILLHFDDVHDLAIIGLASALGIAGHTALEAAIKYWLKNKVKK